MLLALDIGNTSIAGGLFDGSRLAQQFSHDTDKAARDDGPLFDRFADKACMVSAAIAGSVVPDLNSKIAETTQRRLGVPLRFVGRDVPLPIEADLPHPEQAGDDRLLAALAAHRRAGGAAIIVDFGTAVTVDVVGEDGRYKGGVIAPGIRLAARALHEGTALLPQVEIEAPDRVLATDTAAAMQSGLTHGVASMVDGLVRKVRREQDLKDPAVLVTGGYAELLGGLMEEPCEMAGALVLEGLRIAHEEWTVDSG